MKNKFALFSKAFSARAAAFLAFAVLSVLASCSPPKEPEFKNIEDIEILSLGMGEINVKANVVMFNPNSVSILLKKASLDVKVNNMDFGKVNQEYTLELPANETTKFPVEMKGNTKELLKGGNLMGALSLLSSNTVKLNYKGTVDVEALTIKFEIPVAFEGDVNLQQ